MGYATTNPYTGEVVQEFPYATDAEVDAALEAGHAAFQAWRSAQAWTCQLGGFSVHA